MSISVIIPSYNSARVLVEAVNSVLAQTRLPDEIIVINDGSTDDTEHRLQPFADRIRLITQANGGVAVARNRALIESKSEWVAFLDADDVWHPQKLEIQMQCLEANPSLCLLGTHHYDWPIEDVKALTSSLNASPVHITLENLAICNPFTASTVMLRKSVVDKIGLFDIHQFGTEDHDYWLRVAQVFPVAILPVPLAGYRQASSASLSKNARQMETGMRQILNKLESSNLFRGRPLLRRKVWAYFRYSCAYMHFSSGRRLTAAVHAGLSLIGYPLTYSREHVRYRLGRLRLLLAILRGGKS